MRAVKIGAIAAALTTLTSCASTTVRSGQPPGKAALGLDEKWHAAFVFGTIRGTEAIDLKRACPEGWSEIRVEPDPFTLLAGAMTLFFYSPARVTVVCARQAGEERRLSDSLSDSLSW